MAHLLPCHYVTKNTSSMILMCGIVCTVFGSDESTDSRSLQDRKIVVEQRSIEIQTGAPFGFNCQLISQTGLSVMGTSYGLDHVDSTPIAAAIIKPDDLEC